MLKSQATAGILTAFALVTVALIAENSAHLIDVAGAWGFHSKTTYGDPVRNTYILESTGNGAAIFDFDGDGRNDVLITNGTTLTSKAGDGPGLLLFHRAGWFAAGAGPRRPATFSSRAARSSRKDA